MTSAIILAGGLGTRLRGAVPDLPKPMAPVAGRPFLEHQLDYWIAQGVAGFVLSVGYRAEVIREHFGAVYRGVPLDYAVESEPLGTGGGLLLAAARLGGSEPVLVLNGDTFFAVGLADLRAFHSARGSDWTFTLFRATEAGRYMGMELDVDGRIRTLKGSKGGVGALANGGVYLVEPEVLRRPGRTAGESLSLEDDLLAAIQAAGGRLFGMECPGRFIDIGVPADYFRAAEVIH